MAASGAAAPVSGCERRIKDSSIVPDRILGRVRCGASGLRNGSPRSEQREGKAQVLAGTEEEEEEEEEYGT